MRAGDVIAPPYDVVTPDDVQQLRASSRYNIAHVESSHNEGERYYEQAAAALERWQDEGALRRDETPCYYLYEQRFAVQGAVRTRRCFFVRLRLHPPQDGAVRLHESTMAGPVRDRLDLLRATTTNVSPIFAMFDDPTGALGAAFETAAERPPDLEAGGTEEEQRHRLWAVSDEAQLRALTAAVRASAVTIADGHHRYRTALAYAQERPSEVAGWVLAGLVPSDDAGLVILPNHRLVKVDRLPADFLERLAALYTVENITPKSWDGTAVHRLWGRVQAKARGPATFGAIGVEHQQLHVLTARSSAAVDRAMPPQWSPASRSVDVTILTETVLRPLLGIDQATLDAGERVAFTEDIQEAWQRTESGEYRLAFLVNPVRVEQVSAVADAAELMPQKSTFFYPKLPTGLVLNPLD